MHLVKVIYIIRRNPHVVRIINGRLISKYQNLIQIQCTLNLEFEKKCLDNLFSKIQLYTVTDGRIYKNLF